MQLEAIEQPIKYRLRNGNEVTLRPGVPTELPDQAAKQLLRKAPDKVRLVQNVSPIRSGALITWQGADGKPRGPAIVEFLHTDPEGRVWAFYSLPDGGSGAVNTK